MNSRSATNGIGAFLVNGKGVMVKANEVRLQLSVLAYNLENLWRRLVLPRRIESWSLTSLQQRLVKTGGRLVKHAICRPRHMAWNADLRIMPMRLTNARWAAARAMCRSA